MVPFFKIRLYFCWKYHYFRDLIFKFQLNRYRLDFRLPCHYNTKSCFHQYLQTEHISAVKLDYEENIIWIMKKQNKWIMKKAKTKQNMSFLLISKSEKVEKIGHGSFKLIMRKESGFFCFKFIQISPNSIRY